jgi:non-ribosomal peptide synthetase component F
VSVHPGLLPDLTPITRREDLSVFSELSVEHPVLQPAPLADLVREAAAAGAPESVAVEAGDRAVTYGDLVGSADRLADELREAGAGTVAVTGPRGVGFVVAVLAAATAPVRVVTVDPGLPAARRASMLKAAAVDLVLATDEASAVETASLNLVSAKEKESVGTTGEPGRVPVCRLSPDGLTAAAPLPAVGPATGTAAYISFTSGAIGEAKAILGRQSAVAHFTRWQRVRFLAGPGDRFAQLAAPSSDVFLRDVFTPLGAGATLCIPPADVVVRPGGVAAWLGEEGITAVHTVPSLAARWLAVPGPADPWPGLRLTFFGGQPLSDIMVSRWRERFPGTRVINLYGPAETTLAKFCHEVDEPVPGIQPVGRPLPETDLRLVDGEVWIRTPHRTDGYLDDPAETMRRFVRDDGEVWYRTGDLGFLDDLGQLHLRSWLGSSGRHGRSAPPVPKRVTITAGRSRSQEVMSSG